MDNEYFASINEVSRRLSVPAHTLRYWEKQFPVTIRPTTGAGGRRYYRAETVERLMVIKDLLYNRGMTIAGVKKLLRDGNLPSSSDEFLPAASCNASQDKGAAVGGQILDRGELDLAITLLAQAKDILAN